MDLNDLRSISTVLLFIGFNLLMFFVVLRGKDAYKEAANLPFEEKNDHE